MLVILSASTSSDQCHLTNRSHPSLQVFLYPCSQSTFTRKNNLVAHTQKFHTLQSNVTTATPVKKYACAHCSKTFSSNKDLSRHLNSHLGIRDFQVRHKLVGFVNK